MTPQVNAVSLTVFLVIFGSVCVVGFLASHWRRAGDANHLDEWGLGGRNFGPFVTWFLIGGDLYTAYTFVAVPALVYGVGALGYTFVLRGLMGPFAHVMIAARICGTLTRKCSPTWPSTWMVMITAATWSRGSRIVGRTSG